MRKRGELHRLHGLGGLGRRLRDARLAGGISARRLDILAGLGLGHVAMIESGQRPNIEARTSQSIANVLGVSLDWLLLGDGPVPSAEKIMASVAAFTQRRETEGVVSSLAGAGEQMRCTGTDGDGQ